MAREEFEDVVTEVVRGNNFRIRREFTIAELAAGVSITKARLMIKAAATDSDAQAKVTLSITAAQTAAGRILRDGNNAERTAEVSFELSRVDTRNLTPGSAHAFSIRVEDSTGAEYTPFIGTIETREDVQTADIP